MSPSLGSASSRCGAENIAHFLEYARTALTLFGKHAKYWATFNEPGGWMGGGRGNEAWLMVGEWVAAGLVGGVGGWVDGEGE